ncbi:MAG TPA: hypothetical protein DDW19_00540 [Anaerolineaceae bacterium]|nr:hypothetical protein [Anaerolineaceae bacterium]
MKKIITPILVTLILALLITACAPRNITPSAAISATPATAVPTATKVVSTATEIPAITADPATLKGLQIQFMHPWSGKTAEEMAKLTDEFNQTNDWGIHVIVQEPGSSGQVASELASDIASGNQPALVAAPVDVLLKLNQSEKVIEDLNPYLFSMDWGLASAELADLVAAYMQQDSVNGFQYAFPAQRTAVMMFYNSTWARELGFSRAPATFADFRQQSCAANAAMKKDSDSNNDGLGGWIVNTEGLITYSWWTGFNSVLVTDGKYTFDTPAASTAFEGVHDLYTTGCAWIPRVLTSYDYFAKRQALFYSAYLQDILPQIQALAANGSPDAWTLIPFPSSGTQRVVVEGPSYAVLKTTPEKQLASWLFIRWLSSPDQQVRLLQSSLTLPLSKSVRDQLLNSPNTPQQWKDAVTAIANPVPVPSDPNWSLARTILEDASWQLFKTTLTNADIPALLSQMDSTFAELKDRQP